MKVLVASFAAQSVPPTVANAVPVASVRSTPADPELVRTPFVAETVPVGWVTFRVPPAVRVIAPRFRKNVLLLAAVIVMPDAPTPIVVVAKVWELAVEAFWVRLSTPPPTTVWAGVAVEPPKVRLEPLARMSEAGAAAFEKSSFRVPLLLKEFA